MKRKVAWSRDALVELKAQTAYIFRENRLAGRRVAARIRATGDGLADFATGHPGRVPGTYEKSVNGLPYILAYEVDRDGRGETVIILHVIHAARDWQESSWPN